jgi:DNA-binding MarR family transcriptional regulator
MRACLLRSSAPESFALTTANPLKGGDAKLPVYGHTVYDSGVASDMNADVQSALVEVGLRLYDLFFVPGDQLLSLLSTHAPRLARFLGLEAVSHGSALSALISGVIWFVAIIVVGLICELIRDFDRALTAYVVRLYEELQRARRVVARRLSIALRSYALARQARLTKTEVFEEPALSALQLEVLQSHAALPPGYLLTPSEIASALNMRSTSVEQALATLRKLSLIERTFGAGDGEDGYRLTRPGAVFLAACNRTRPIEGTPSPQRAQRPKRIEPSLGNV